jgi:hypothetical protein
VEAASPDLARRAAQIRAGRAVPERVVRRVVLSTLRYLLHHRQVVAIGDGAAWIWTTAQARYPHATHITDICHAREHLHDLASHLAFITPDPAGWREDRLAEFGTMNIEAIIHAARQYPLEGIRAAGPDTIPGYFEHNIHRMRYARFKSPGMFTGPGAIEGRLQADRRPATQAARHALDHQRRRPHHCPALPARHQPPARTRARRQPPTRPAARRHLTHSTTQTPRPRPTPRSSSTNLSCTRPSIRGHDGRAGR